MIRSRLHCYAAPALLALLAAAGPALAQSGINLSWTDCGAAGNASRTFACNSNTGASTLVASIFAGAEIPQLTGMQSAILLQTNQASLSNWWQFGPGGCRSADPAVLSVDFNPPTENCINPWTGGAFGSLVYEPEYGSPNEARVRVFGFPSGAASMNGYEQHYVFRLSFSYAHSTGEGACTGCTDGVCLTLHYVRLIQPVGIADLLIQGPASRDYVTWQSGGGLGGQCPGVDGTGKPPVATRGSTWGAVKSMYR